MNKLYMRRRHPLSIVVSVLVFFLLFTEAFVLFGGFEIDAKTVYKTAPWLHPYYLKLVGEDPDSIREWNRFFEEQKQAQKKEKIPETPLSQKEKEEKVKAIKKTEEKKSSAPSKEEEPVG